jgi:hypothetical protein
MINNAIYYDNNIVYKSDFVISIQKPKIYKTTILIFHNDKDLEQSYEFFQNVIKNNLNLINYQIIYTSDITKIHYDFKILGLNYDLNYNSNYELHNLNKDIYKICKNELYTVILFTGYNNTLIIDKYNINFFKMFMYNTNIEINNLVICYNSEICQTTNNMFQYITDIATITTIEIIDSNIKDIINYKHVINNSLTDVDNITFFHQNNNKYIKNYITYKINGFNKYVKTINLENNDFKLIDFKLQLLSIQNYFIDLVNKNYIIKNTNIYKIYINTLNYYKKYIKENYSSIISCITFNYNLLQEKYIIYNLNNQPIDYLFNIYLNITSSFIKNKMYNVYIKNIKKIKNIKYDQPLINLDNENQTILNKSLEFYVSYISLTNWKDEIDNNQCLGLLINCKCNESDILGFTSNTITINNVTNTLISIEQIYDGHIFFYNKYLKFDNGKEYTNMISGLLIGNGNAMIPLYINKYHWKIAETKVEEQISVAITQNPYSFKVKMLDIYSHVLLKFIEYIVYTDNSNKNIKLFISLIITMIKLKLNFNFNYNINNIIKIHNIKTLIVSYIINIFVNNDKFDDNIFKLLYSEYVRRFIKHNKIYINSIDDKNIIEFKAMYILTNLIKDHMNNLINKYETQLGWIDDNDILMFKNINMNCFNNIIYKLKDDIVNLQFHLQLSKYIDDKIYIKNIKNNIYINYL